MFWLGLAIGLIVGGNLGVVTISLFRINKN